MRFQLILFFFCALYVFGTFGEKEDYKANHHMREKSHHDKYGNKKAQSSSHGLDRHKKTETKIHASSHFRQLAFRDGNGHCHVVCDDGKSPSNASYIQIKYKGTSGLIAYLNDSAQVAAIYDYSSNISATLNGQSGAVVVEDHSKQKYYAVEKNAQMESVVWLASKTDFTAYFKTLASLENLLKVGQEQGKTLNSTEDLFKTESADLAQLGIIASETNFTLTIELMAQLNTTLKFIFKGEGSFIIHKNLIWFTKLNLAFAEIFRDSQSELQSSDLKLNLTTVYGASSGVEALVNLLTQIGNRVDLSKLLRNQIRSPETELELLEKLSGGSNEGDDGIVTVVVTVIRAINGRCMVNDVITVILNYTSEGESSSLAKVVDDALDLLESQNRVFNNSAFFREIITVLKAINDHNLVFNNVNISDIITLLTNRNPITMIQTIIRIFSRFAGTQGFSRYIREFIENISSPHCSNIISRLFPGVDIGNARNIVLSFLSNIPVIGNIFRPNSTSSITGAIQNASSGVISGFEDTVNSFVNGFIGLGSNGASSTSAPESTTATSPPSTSGNGNSNTSDGSGATKGSDSGISVTTPSSDATVGSSMSNPANTTSGSNETNTSVSGNNATPPSSSAGNITISTGPSSGATESPNTSTGTTSSDSGITNGTTQGTTSGTSATTGGSTGTENVSTKTTPAVRKGHIHKFQEKKNDHHQHLHTLNKNEHVHSGHKFQEKQAYEHLQKSERKEKLHNKLEEKDIHQAHHLHAANKHGNVHSKHHFQNKEFLEKSNKGTQERKYDDHHHHHH